MSQPGLSVSTGNPLVAKLRGLPATNQELIDRTLIENAHDLHFDKWAAMWGIEDRVTELLPDAEASRRAWAKYEALW